ncbi:helix-turn-helix transcriptional regulator [Enterobacter ludwigii]|jgi:DNA-binding CsgD family transcriptional regulator
MIYIITDNHFLFDGVRHAMHPTIVIKTSIDWILKYDFFVGNFILIDDEIIRDASPQAYNLNKKNTVFFLNTLKNANIDFMKIHSSFHAFDRHISIEDFRIRMLKVVTGKDSPTIIRTKMMLTTREHQVLLASLHGKTAQEIASSIGLKDKTIYSHRKSACLKLSVTRFIDIVLTR